MSKAIEDIALDELLPQKPPFVMIDRLLSSDDTSAVTELEIREDNVFFEKGCLSPSGLVENIAQTCAAGIGYNNLNANENVKIGVIGAMNQLCISRLPRKGERITTRVQYVEEVFQMVLFDAVVSCEGEVLAKTAIKTVLTDINAN